MPPMVLDYTMPRLDGTEEPLTSYKGKVLLLVNVASACGLTPQYSPLQALQDKYGERGFCVLGFPANNFMGQEPGTNDEIATFCETQYGVTFPVFSKISVAGDDMHPLYKEITTLPEPLGGDILWNFQKYLVDREGNVVAKFGPRTTPDDPAVIEAIEALL
ncbi:MAG: glutathione peroxidase [Dehalococcoidia bacterium]|nr:glutathione peroxidase [Dehalococcoidia bacterium]